MDAIYSPIRRANYSVENIRVGQRTDFERLVLEIWTDGSVSPVEALRKAGDILVDDFFLFKNAQKVSEDGGEGPPIALRISPEQYNIPVERLDLSSRTLNCLKRASIDKVGQILEMKKADLLQIKNFGEKSLNELYGRLDEMDLLPPELDPDVEQADDTGEEEEEVVAEAVTVGAESSEGEEQENQT